VGFADRDQVAPDGVPGVVVPLCGRGGEAGQAENVDQGFAWAVGDPQALGLHQQPGHDRRVAGERGRYDLFHQRADRQHPRVIDFRAVQVVVLVGTGRPRGERSHALTDHRADGIHLGQREAQPGEQIQAQRQRLVHPVTVGQAGDLHTSRHHPTQRIRTLPLDRLIHHVRVVEPAESEQRRMPAGLRGSHQHDVEIRGVALQ
jgi:hypothetical protein